ncbi:MAG: hypothetical protein K1X74_17355 [Pirellulales bacterium]|nr:hypothetical protein [Pirellulales bacterium]
MATPPRPGGFAYRVDPRLHLTAQGRPTGEGSVQFHDDGGPIKEFAPSPTQFALLVLLIEAAQRAAATGRPADAFVPAKVLAQQVLKRLGRGEGSRLNVHKQIYKLRQRLTEAELAAYVRNPAERFGWALIERHPNLGYRLSLPPENLTLLLSLEPLDAVG